MLFRKVINNNNNIRTHIRYTAHGLFIMHTIYLSGFGSLKKCSEVIAEFLKEHPTKFIIQPISNVTNINFM